MTTKINNIPDCVFEVSWEVCNMVGGIYTVVSTKAPQMIQRYNDQFITIGPDLYKGDSGESDFQEDNTLFSVWKEHFAVDGIKVRIGRWLIPGQPLTILIDYYPLFDHKDEILAELWVKNKLDSLKGGWDYIEPLLFGYAAGKVIEDFLNFHGKQNDKTIAHFHEWLTGGGVLYLENNVPAVATVFTTHATVTGRAIAGSGMPFYSKFESYVGDQVAKKFNSSSKHSLEKKAAAIAEAFSTVSSKTAKECSQLIGKAVDSVTPNGFDDSFVPDDSEFDAKRHHARDRLLKVGEAVLGYSLPADTLIIGTSGRYEYRNKGLDIYVDTLAKLNQKEGLGKTVLSYIMVPAAHTNVRQGILQRMEHGLDQLTENYVATHYLQNQEEDMISRQLAQLGINNSKELPVKVVYVPIYLNGQDGLFNMSYYDLLIGFDLTLFPSYYEPFGYTPLESLAFHVPTVTTTLTGFGTDLKRRIKSREDGMLIIDRTDSNDLTVIDQMVNHIHAFSNMSREELLAVNKKAYELSRLALWSNRMEEYDQLYDLSLSRQLLRSHMIVRTFDDSTAPPIELPESNEPNWKSILVEFHIPDALKDLETLCKNLWWTWNLEASQLFESIDPIAWQEVNRNPIELLSSLPYHRLSSLSEDKDFMAGFSKVFQNFTKYMENGGKKTTPKIAYLCLEYGLHTSLPIYSGGLGILAGDFLKEASDQNVEVVGFGLMYRYGYFNQALNLQGEQVESNRKLSFTRLPISPVNDQDGNRVLLQVPFRSAMVYSQVWKVEVGRVPLYLFDTDIPQNSDENKVITHHLYGGGKAGRFRQEMLIAINSVQLMDVLEISPDVYHYNEGHTAFTGLVRILRLVRDNNLNFDEALTYIKSSTLFTTHTPVKAGHDTFEESLMRSFNAHYSDTMNISWDRLIGYGRLNHIDHSQSFSMSYLAARTAGEINGVSRKHGSVSRQMFNPLWKGFFKEELPIGYITNGVHYETWTAFSFQKLFRETMGESITVDQSEGTQWSKVEAIPDQKIWDIRVELKRNLIDAIRNRLSEPYQYMNNGNRKKPDLLINFNEHDFIIGFARRFVTYKRVDLIFKDLKRLASIINRSGRPVKFLFAGKAHPADKEGKQLIKNVTKVANLPEFEGKIIFIPDYDMEMGRLLVQGVDLWLNTPTRGMEASGTSGMKAVLNGVLNLSVMDGWWSEAYRKEVGWALPEKRYFESQSDQDQLDAETIYDLLEYDIVPTYYKRNKEGVPENWIAKIKSAWQHIAPKFTTGRMMKEYLSKYYEPIAIKHKQFAKDNFKLSKEIAAWNQFIKEEWSKISVVNEEVSVENQPLRLGDKLKAEITLDLGIIPADQIGVELIFAGRDKEGGYEIKNVEILHPVESTHHQVTYVGEATANHSGTYKYDIRYFPSNPQLNYRSDIPLVKWI